MSRISGTKEWATDNVNCCLGCSHNCRYCYARANAMRFGKISSPEEWPEERTNNKALEKKFGKKTAGRRFMFPTTHDITPANIDACLQLLKNVLSPGNEVLIVSKPHLECISRLIEELVPFKGQCMFRFTIGAMDDDILSFWEPGAPGFLERLDSLRIAAKDTWKTSVSMEPLLDADNVRDLFFALEPWVTDSIWIGKMNRIALRVLDKSDPLVASHVARIQAGQTDERVKQIYEMLKNEPKVRWKEAYKSVLGLEMPKEAGLDI